MAKSDAGLHASIRKDSTQKLEWKAVGLGTVDEVEATLRSPLVFSLLLQLTGDAPPVPKPPPPKRPKSGPISEALEHTPSDNLTEDEGMDEDGT